MFSHTGYIHGAVQGKDITVHKLWNKAMRGEERRGELVACYIYTDAAACPEAGPSLLERNMTHLQ